MGVHTELQDKFYGFHFSPNQVSPKVEEFEAQLDRIACYPPSCSRSPMLRGQRLSLQLLMLHPNPVLSASIVCCQGTLLLNALIPQSVLLTNQDDMVLIPIEEFHYHVDDFVPVEDLTVI